MSFGKRANHITFGFQTNLFEFGSNREKKKNIFKFDSNSDQIEKDFLELAISQVALQAFDQVLQNRPF